MSTSIPQTPYRHISDKERYMIELYLHQGYSITKIAMILHRNYSSIHREIKRNGGPRVYDAEKAGNRARKRWELSHKKERIACHFLRLYIIIQLYNGWSPEQIAGRLSLDYPSYSISHETIYQYIYHDAPHLYVLLRKAHKKRKKRHPVLPYTIPNRTPLSELGDISHEYGHWEVDLVGSSSHATVLILTEKKARFVLLHKIPHKKARTVMYGILFCLRNIPLPLCKSFIYDNGKENVFHDEINKRLGSRSYFCTPYHAWEKGLVENTIGLFRQYFPKQTNFYKIRQDDIIKVQQLLNNRPRKCLHFLTSAEIFYALAS